MGEGLYLFAFLDFQKHGKRPENDLLRTLTQTEIKEEQFRLSLIKKTMQKSWRKYYPHYLTQSVNFYAQEYLHQILLK
jgi:hypothetical protein